MSASTLADVAVTGRDIPYKPFSFYEGFVYKLLDVDMAHRTVEMILKFEPDSVCFYHRHLGPVASLVLEGEHHIKEVHADGKEATSIRRAGEFTMSDHRHAHIEGGGPAGGVIFFSFRCEQDHIYDILDEDLNVVHQVTVQDFKAALDAWN